mmetsp:Transcript_26245/g.72450  ORF Transcript_26245/g.72450 Transcript_26245/m.72450 type:complete len:724 (-) Transcript_26245:191-2362(-)
MSFLLHRAASKTLAIARTKHQLLSRQQPLGSLSSSGLLLHRNGNGNSSHDHSYNNNNNNNNHSYNYHNVRFKSVVPTGSATGGTIVDGSINKDALDDPQDVIDEQHRQGKPWMWDMGLPTLVPEWKRAFFTPSTILTDVSAGITVGCIAVPLSLAIAVASGVPAEVGLVTAAVSGVAGGLMGGTTLAVTGPAAAISLLVIGAVHEHGLEALPLITLGCGGLQLISGVTRLGVAAKLVPVSVIAGFTTGVGVMILSGQAPKALGLTSAPAGMNPIETAYYCAEHLLHVNPAAAALAAGTSAAMIFLPKLHPKMPSALLAVGGATVATHSLGLDVGLIGQIPSGLGAFQLLGMPTMPSVSEWPSLFATTFLIYAMTSAESLLSCAALEKMKKTSYKHNPDQELIGQGLANIASGAFMGMPVTSVIARSSLNVKLNAHSRLPAIVQAGFVFGGVVLFSETISSIPMPALSGMLITTGMFMLNPTEFKHCYAVEKMDTIPFLATIGGMMSYGLAEGIGIGCVTAACLIYDYGKLHAHEILLPLKATTRATQQSRPIEDGKLLSDDQALINQQQDDNSMTTAWQLQGPINFRNMMEIEDLILRIKASESVQQGNDPIVLDMQGVSSVEFTGVEELANRLIEVSEDRGATVQMWNCSDNLQNALAQCDPKQLIAANGRQSSDEIAPYTFPTTVMGMEDLDQTPRVAPMYADSIHFIPRKEEQKEKDSKR